MRKYAKGIWKLAIFWALTNKKNGIYAEKWTYDNKKKEIYRDRFSRLRIAV